MPHPAGGLQPCGAEMRHCACGHHQSLHRQAPPEMTRRGACQAEGCQCAAFAGQPCTRPGNGAGGRCKAHGGLSLAGPANGMFRGGNYRPAMRGRMRKLYERAMADEQLLSLREEIAAMRAFAVDLAMRQRDLAWGAPAAGRRFADLEAAWAELQDAEGGAQRLGIMRRIGEAMSELRDAVDAAEGERKMRAEFRQTAETLERLARSENTRVVELYSMISSERAFALRQAETQILLDALEALVPDREQRAAIRRRVAHEFAKLAGRGTAAEDGTPPVADLPEAS